MIITGISRYGEKASQKRPRYKIEVDGEYWYILSDVLIADFHLRKGMEVDEAFLQKVREAADYRKGRERAFYLLEEREHTRDELTRKLARSVGFETAGKIAGEMESLGLIREDAYAARYAQYLSEIRRYGRRRIVQEMMKKGFSRDTIDGALTGIETDEDALEALAFKKYGRALRAELEAGEEAEPSGFNRGGFTKAENRAIQGLMRLGHGFSEARAAVEAVEEAIREEMEEER